MLLHTTPNPAGPAKAPASPQDGVILNTGARDEVMQAFRENRQIGYRAESRDTLMGGLRNFLRIIARQDPSNPSYAWKIAAGPKGGMLVSRDLRGVEAVRKPGALEVAIPQQAVETLLRRFDKVVLLDPAGTNVIAKGSVRSDGKIIFKSDKVPDDAIIMFQKKAGVVRYAADLLEKTTGVRVPLTQGQRHITVKSALANASRNATEAAQAA